MTLVLPSSMHNFRLPDASFDFAEYILGRQHQPSQAERLRREDPWNIHPCKTLDSSQGSVFRKSLQPWKERRTTDS